MDTDDVAYRLATLVQMAGVLVLAAGVPAALHHEDYAVVKADPPSVLKAEPPLAVAEPLPPSVPEPGSLATTATGLVALLMVRRYRLS